MTKKCTHKDKNGKVCGHINADGNSYCVKCGNLLDGVNEKIVVNKSDYTLNLKKVEEVESEKKRLQKDIDDLKTKGYAPSGFHLEKNKSIWEEYSKKTLPILEYDRLVRRANQSWYGKLWDAIKRWWDESAFGIIFLAIIFGGTILVILAIEGIARSCSNESDEISFKIAQRDGLWGMTNGKNVVLPFEYDSIVSDKYDTIYSRIYKDERIGLVNNTTGKVIIPCIYNAIGHLDKSSFRGKLIAVQKEDKKWHFVDYSGKPTGTLYYDYAEWTANSDYGTVGLYIDGSIKYGFANSDGFIQIKCQYVTVYNFNEGLAVVRSKPNGPLECIDTRGKRIYTLKQNIASVYCDSLMPVSNSYKWDANSTLGFLDRKGNLAIGMYFTPYIFSNGSTHIPFFNNGKAYVRYNGKNGWIDKTGRFTPVN